MSASDRYLPLASLLRGEMIRRVIAALQLQPNTLDSGQAIKLSGSTVPYLLSQDTNVKIPSDIDIAVHTDDGLRPRTGWPEETVKALVAHAAATIGYEFKPVPATSGNEHCGEISHCFNQSEIDTIVKKFGCPSLLEANGLAPQSIAQGIRVALPVHYVHNPINILPALPYEGARRDLPAGALRPFLQDDIRELFSLKLARIILGRNKGEHPDVSDMLDVKRILDNSKMRDVIMRDGPLLRLLVVAFMAEQIEEENHAAMRFAFSSDEASSTDFACGLHAQGFLVSSLKDIKAVLAAVDGVIGTIFPERAQGVVPLTDGERRFIDNALHPDPSRLSTQSIDVELLVQGKQVNPLDLYPHLGKAIHYSNALNNALERHGARREYF